MPVTATAASRLWRRRDHRAGERASRAGRLPRLGALGQQGKLRRLVAPEEIRQPDRVVAGEAGVAELRRRRVAQCLAPGAVAAVDGNEGEADEIGRAHRVTPGTN